MIRAEARIESDGLLVDFCAEGHAGKGPRGYDVVCAAFTVLVRTAYGSLEGISGASLEGSAPGPGRIDFHVKSVPDAERGKAIGMSAFLLEGLAGLEREFPEAIGVRTETVRRN